MKQFAIRIFQSSGVTTVISLSLVAALMSAAASAQGPQLSFRSLNGQAVSLGDNRGKVTVLSFSATWAPLAAKELPQLQKLADMYSGRSVVVHWVSIDSLKQGAKNYAADADVGAFASRYGLKVPVLRDPDQTAYRALGLRALPTVVVIDQNGKVVFNHVGFDPDQPDAFRDVVRTIDGLLK